MNQFTVFVAAASAVLCASSQPTLATQQVDAVAAATINQSCQFITPIPVTAASATVSWFEGHNDGTATFCYGAANPPTICHTVTASERIAGSVNLSGLSAFTRYNVTYDVAKPGETAYGATGSFTTASSAVLAPVAAAAVAGQLRVGSTLVAVAGGVRGGDVLTVTNSNGRVVQRLALSQGGANLVVNGLAQGIYIVSVSRAGRQVAAMALPVKGRTVLQ
jgi:hypothetical protein